MLTELYALINLADTLQAIKITVRSASAVHMRSARVRVLLVDYQHFAAKYTSNE